MKEGMKWIGELGANGEPKTATPPPVKDPEIVEVENHIYFYSEITRDKIMKLNKVIRAKETLHLIDQIKRGAPTPDPIHLHINSYGGSIFAGIAGMDQIIETKKRVPVYTIIDGCCASAGTFLSVVGSQRSINAHAFTLIHQFTSCMWGKYSEFQDEMKNLKKLMALLSGIYLEYTEVPEEKLKTILKHDLWFDAKKSKKLGIVDEIL